MKNSKLFFLGLLNAFHPLLHLIQSFQSLVLVVDSHQHEEGVFSFLHHPIVNILWGIVGIYTLYLIFKDKGSCNHKH